MSVTLIADALPSPGARRNPLGEKRLQGRSAAESDTPNTSAGPENENPYARWSELVERIQLNDAGGLEELYRIFSRGVRYYLCRQLGSQEIDDKVHDTFLIVVQAIQRGELRDPQRLMGFVRTVVRRQVAAHIDRAIHARKERVDLDDSERLPYEADSPEEVVMREQRAEIMMEILRDISVRDREILTRFYIQEQAQGQICSEMGLSETQFRLLKSRAKARFGELGRRRLVSRPLSRMAQTIGDRRAEAS